MTAGRFVSQYLSISPRPTFSPAARGGTFSPRFLAAARSSHIFCVGSMPSIRLYMTTNMTIMMMPNTSASTVKPAGPAFWAFSPAGTRYTRPLMARMAGSEMAANSTFTSMLPCALRCESSVRSASVRLITGTMDVAAIMKKLEKNPPTIWKKIIQAVLAPMSRNTGSTNVMSRQTNVAGGATRSQLRYWPCLSHTRSMMMAAMMTKNHSPTPVTAFTVPMTVGSRPQISVRKYDQ